MICVEKLGHYSTPNTEKKKKIKSIDVDNTVKDGKNMDYSLLCPIYMFSINFDSPCKDMT